MPDLTPDIRLLLYLSEYGIGNYRDITELLADMFNDGNKYISSKEQLTEFLYRMEHFMDEMEANDYIKRISTGDNKIKAYIREKGIEKLQRQQHPIHGQISVVGSGNNIINQSSSASLETDNIKPITNITNKATAKPNNKRSWLEILYWVAGIGTFVFVVIQFFYPSKTHENDNNRTDTIPIIKEDTIGKKSEKERVKSEKQKPIIIHDSIYINQPVKPFQFTSNQISLYKDSPIGFLSTSLPSSFVSTTVTSNEIDEILNFMPFKKYRINIYYIDSPFNISSSFLAHDLEGNLSKYNDSVFVIRALESSYNEEKKSNFIKDVSNRFGLTQNDDENYIGVWVYPIISPADYFHKPYPSLIKPEN